MTETAPHILLVDDDPSLKRLLVIRMEAQNYRVRTANDGREALRELKVHDIDLVVSDLRMDGMDGIELFEEIQQQHPGMPVIIITAQGSISDAVSATQKGVFGFLTKPVDKDELFGQMEQALAQSSRPKPDADEPQWCSHILTRSESMERLLQTAKRVAESDVSVLVTGASGTGKELMAQAIHRGSPRRDQPFIPINCGALPEPLLESELFGHIKGAFTGASSDHLGLLRSADGGTLFLDEIGDMAVPLQVKLLRVLQERQVRPVGSTQNYPVDVRIISATHRDLEKAMQDGQFREDLYYRLNVVNLKVPPLSERREDIPLLANHFLKQCQESGYSKAAAFSPEAMNLLVGASWPGNVRQLENAILQVVALAHTKLIPEALVRDAIASESGVMPSFNESRVHFERDYLVKVLRLTEGNVSRAAKLAQRNRTDFYKLLQRHDLKPDQFKS